jgi:hypothetical protein
LPLAIAIIEEMRQGIYDLVVIGPANVAGAAGKVCQKNGYGHAVVGVKEALCELDCGCDVAPSCHRNKHELCLLHHLL